MELIRGNVKEKPCNSYDECVATICHLVQYTRHCMNCGWSKKDHEKEGPE